VPELPNGKKYAKPCCCIPAGGILPAYAERGLGFSYIQKFQQTKRNFLMSTEGFQPSENLQIKR